MTEIELAYLAGFFDGEGSVVLYPERRAKRGSWKMIIEVRNVDKLSIELFHVAFGGSVKPILSENPNWKDYWAWTCEARLAETALRAMLPYLRLKRERVLVALEYRSTVRQGRPYYTDAERQNQTRLALLLRKLNKRGRAA